MAPLPGSTALPCVSVRASHATRLCCAPGAAAAAACVSCVTLTRSAAAGARPSGPSTVTRTSRVLRVGGGGAEVAGSICSVRVSLAVPSTNERACGAQRAVCSVCSTYSSPCSSRPSPAIAVGAAGSALETESTMAPVLRSVIVRGMTPSTGSRLSSLRSSPSPRCSTTRAPASSGPSQSSSRSPCRCSRARTSARGWSSLKACVCGATPPAPPSGTSSRYWWPRRKRPASCGERTTRTSTPSAVVTPSRTVWSRTGSASLARVVRCRSPPPPTLWSTSARAAAAAMSAIGRGMKSTFISPVIASALTSSRLGSMPRAT